MPAAAAESWTTCRSLGSHAGVYRSVSRSVRLTRQIRNEIPSRARPVRAQGIVIDLSDIRSDDHFRAAPDDGVHRLQRLALEDINDGFSAMAACRRPHTVVRRAVARWPLTS